MTIEEKTTYVDEAKSLMLNQDKEKPLLEALVSALVEPVQELETAAFEVFLSRLIDNATKAQLEILGRIVGQPRGIHDDDTYRRYIKARIAINRSNGKVHELLNILAIISENGESYRFRDRPPASMVLDILHQITAKTKLSFGDATFDRDSDAYLLAHGELAKFDPDVPAFVEMGGRQCVQIEREYTNSWEYGKQMNEFDTFFIGSSWSQNAIADPFGEITAEKLIETAIDDSHQVRDSATARVNGNNLVGIFAKASERYSFRLRVDGPVPNAAVLYDLNAVTSTIVNGSVSAHGIIPLNNNWYFCYFIFDDDGNPSTTNTYLAMCDTPGNYSYQGVAGYGMYFWGLDIKGASYFTSPILTDGSQETKNADKLEWSEAKVAENSWVRERFSIVVYPNYSSDQIGEDHVLFCYKDSTEDIYGYFDSNARFNIEGSVNGLYLQTDALEWTEMVKITIVIYANRLGSSRVQISGLDGGDIEELGDPFTVIDGAFQLGMRNNDDFFDGKLSEPYDPDGVPPFVQSIDEIIREAKMAGVGFQTTWSSQLSTKRFKLSSQSGAIDTSEDQGLANATQTTGGHLRGVI